MDKIKKAKGTSQRDKIKKPKGTRYKKLKGQDQKK